MEMLEGYYYLANPYSGTPHEMQERFEAAEKATVYFLLQNTPIYSPIVHCHEMAKKHELPTDAGFWNWYNRVMLQNSHALYVLTLPGWKQSNGVELEIQHARSVGLPIYSVNPNHYQLTLGL